VTRWGAAALAVAATVAAAARPAAAFCGFYVSGSDAPMANDATQVVLMRMGTRTVLSMQNNYKGPPEAFALVIPVPVVLHEGDVKTLEPQVFARVERMGAPRLVEYWEQDPCAPEPDYATTGSGYGIGSGRGGMGLASAHGVTVEAQFAVGEYQIVILSAKDSTGLDAWLREQQYQVPAGAEPLLRPYVESGSKFFVAKVDPKKVTFEDGRAALSPLRFHYDAEEFSLPIRLGLASSSGTQDLIVSIFAPAQRYEVANYPNVTVPTNLDVDDSVRDRFGEFYAALFDRTLAKNPGAVVTEYAWQASTCDPCPGPRLTEQDLATLGADVLTSGPDRAGLGRSAFVLTRLHARYGKEVKDDLVFKAAAGIIGGREDVAQGGQLDQGARASTRNSFQARYAIRHPWTGPIQCANPTRGRWGGPWPGVAKAEGSGERAGAVKGATGLAFARRGGFALGAALRLDVPALGITAGAAEPVGSEAAAASSVSSAAGSAATAAAGSAATPAKPPTKQKTGCGCAAAGPAHGWLDAAMLLAMVWLGRRRRPALAQIGCRDRALGRGKDRR
jgi:MYXO-CTERM domain-containing protein